MRKGGPEIMKIRYNEPVMEVKNFDHENIVTDSAAVTSTTYKEALDGLTRTEGVNETNIFTFNI